VIFFSQELTHMYEQGLDRKEVAVSKLCCPSCWEYFDILSEKHKELERTQMYNIRGRHSTIYPVQLPAWTSPDVVEELIKRFREHLRNKLIKMKDQQKMREKLTQSSRGHAHSPSLQSIISSVTDASDNSVESNINDDAENTMVKMNSSKMFPS
jgi:hypothetical protein